MLSNITIPFDKFRLPNLATRVSNFIDSEYERSGPLKFEISASYVLVHKISRQTRTWTGSFSPKRDFAITPLLPFSRDTLVHQLNPFLNIDHLATVLTRRGLDSNWIFHSVTALIVHATAIVPLHAPVIARRNILHVGRGKKRRVITFDLP